MSDNVLLTGPEAAAVAGVDSGTWRSYHSRGYAPPADRRDASTSWRPCWYLATIKAWLETGRDGQGKRTDLIQARADKRRQLEAERTTTTAAPAPGLHDWLATHHATLLAVADLLVDHRDELMDASTDPDGLAEAIDAAGDTQRKHPTKGFASAVVYALSMIRRTTRRVDPELASLLEHRWWLHEQFQPWAGPTT